MPWRRAGDWRASTTSGLRRRVEWSRENKTRLFAEVEFDKEQRLERLMLRWVERGGGTLKELWRYLGSTGKTEAVHRKLRAMSGLGLIGLSKSLDDRSREPLRIYPIRSDG